MEAMQLPRVLVFHPALAPYRIDLFNALSQRLQMRLVFLHQDVPYQSYSQATLKHSLAAEYGFATKGWKLLGREFPSGIYREIESFRPEVVVTHEFSPVTLRVALGGLLKPIPHVVWTSDNPNIVTSEHPLRRVARRAALSRIDGLIVYSEETKELYERRFGFKGPIGVCPNAQSERALREKLQGALPASRSLVLSHELVGKQILLFVGRLAKVKRVDRLIRAFAIVSKEFPSASLVLVGDGPEREHLERQAHDAGIRERVKFVGHCEGTALYAWFNLGAVLALTSESETWGAVVNEALLAGMPVVCSECAGARVLIVQEANGTVVDAQDAVGLSKSLKQWLARAPTIASELAFDLRRPLMMHTFSDAVTGFLSPIFELLTDHARADIER